MTGKCENIYMSYTGKGENDTTIAGKCENIYMSYTGKGEHDKL